MPKHLATRLAVFYCASALSGAFSGLLAAGIAKMSGVGGLEGWRWIFILEGIATVVLGVLCFFFLIDSPKLSGKWLSQDEIRFLELQHFIKDGGQFQEERKSTSWKDIKAVLGNWRMYLLAYILLAQSACSYGMFLLSSRATKIANPHKQEPNSRFQPLPRVWASKTQPHS
jgi:MFS family permease